MNIWEKLGAIKIKTRCKFVRFTSVESLPGNKLGDFFTDTFRARISKKQSELEAHFCGYHEYLHAVSEAYGLGLSEEQVEGIEDALRYTYHYNKGFSLDPKWKHIRLNGRKY